MFLVHPVNGEVPPVKGRPRKLPHYANRGKTSSSGGELASARSCFSTVRTALGKLRITGLLAQFDVARSFPQFPRPLLLQPTILTSERGTRFGIRKAPNQVPPPHLPDDPCFSPNFQGNFGLDDLPICLDAGGVPHGRARCLLVHPVNGEVPPVKGRPRKLPHYANRGKTSSSGGELASARSCFSTVRTALGKLRIAGLLAQFDVARSFPQFPRPLLLQPTILTSERGTRFGIRKPPNHVPPPHLPDDPVYFLTFNPPLTIPFMSSSIYITGSRSNDLGAALLEQTIILY